MGCLVSAPQGGDSSRIICIRLARLNATFNPPSPPLTATFMFGLFRSHYADSVLKPKLQTDVLFDDRWTHFFTMLAHTRVNLYLPLYCIVKVASNMIMGWLLLLSGSGAACCISRSVMTQRCTCPAELPVTGSNIS